MTIRVLFIQSQSFFGADSYIHALLMRYFDRSAVEVHVACTTERMDPAISAARRIGEIPDVRVRPMNFGPSIFGTGGWTKVRRVARGWIVPISLASLASYIRRRRIQVIHGTEKPRDAFYGVLLGRLTGAKSVIHMHVGYGEWQSAHAKWALRHADGVVGVSNFVANSVIAAGIPRARVFAVLNSVDLSSWDPTLDGSATRRALGIPDDAPVVGIVARLFKWKGHGDLLEALAIIRQEFPDVRLVIVGEDDRRAHPGRGSYRAELEAQARRLGLEGHVIFAGFRTDIPQVMAAFDVYAMPSWEEPLGVAYLEAMAMRKPVVAWANGGAPEVIVHNEAGFLCPPGSIASLADAILALLRDPALRRSFGEEGRRRVTEVLTPQRMSEAMLEVYRAILDAPPNRGLGERSPTEEAIAR